jgi:hypothetical protein
MMKNAHTIRAGARTIAAILTAAIAATPAAARDRDTLGTSDLSLALTSSRLASLSETVDDPAIDISARLQFRYAYNRRQMPVPAVGADRTTLGFQWRRLNIAMKGKVTDSLSASLQTSTRTNEGDMILERVYGTWKLSDTVKIDFGQFRINLIREEDTSASRQLATERSAGNETINQDFTQAVQVTITEDRWRAFFAFSDGIDAENTMFLSTREADVALSGRLEARFGDAAWSAYKQYTSWRGSPTGLLAGAAILYQTMGGTNIAVSPTTDMTIATADLSLVADGWNAAAAIVWRRLESAGTPDFDDFTALVQGGVFVSDQDEFFARYSAVMPDSDRAPRDSNFIALTFGWNHYIIPESHAAKFTLDVTTTLDATNTSIVRTSASFNNLPDMDSGQLAITAQMQILF